MSKMCLVNLAVLLLALHLLSSQVVHAQNTTRALTAQNATRATNTTTMAPNATSTEKSGSGGPAAFTLLLPLALGASLLHGWS